MNAIAGALIAAIGAGLWLWVMTTPGDGQWLVAATGGVLLGLGAGKVITS